VRWAPLVVLLLLGAAAQGPQAYDSTMRNEAAVWAPVQVVLDAIPDVVSLAVLEASDDGTPDDAEALVARLSNYRTGLQAPTRFPSQSVAASLDASNAYAFAEQAFLLARAVPASAVQLARASEACSVLRVDAVATYWRLAGEVGEADLALREVASALEELLAAPPPGIDATPVARALAMLTQWHAATSAEADGCLAALAQRIGAEVLFAGRPAGADTLLVAWLAPERTWSGGRVGLLGRATGPPGGPVQVASTPLRADLPRAASGAFQTAFDAPTGLGAYPVTVSYGARSVLLSLQVVKAPVELELLAPYRAEPGARVEATVRWHSPAPHLLGDQSILARGDRTAQRPLASFQATFAFTAPEAGSMRVRFIYPGSDVLEAAEVEWVLIVADDAADAAQDGARERGGGWGRGGGLFPEAPFEPWLFLVVILLIIVLLVALEFWLRRRRQVALVAPRAAAAVPPRGLPSGFVAAFAAFVAWWVRLGVARKSWTAREVGEALQGQGVAVGGLVRRFEATRYGGARAPDGSRARAWLQRVQAFLWRRR
jgi:hypothetical protein